MDEVREAYDPIRDLAVVLTAVLYDAPAGFRYEDSTSLERLRKGLSIEWKAAGRLAVTLEVEAAIRGSVQDFITKTGKLLTPAELDAYVAEAERGYDPKQISYAGPTGRERPGEHWNARIIREMAEAGAAFDVAELTEIRNEQER
jgi:hypothetical protein